MFNSNINYYSNSDIKFKGFSGNTVDFGNMCIKELTSSGISIYDSVCFLVNEKGVFYLYCNNQELGFLSNENDGSDVLFKKLIASVYKDIGAFYCLAFPCNTEWYPFSNRLVAYKTKEAFSGVSSIIFNGSVDI